MGTSIYIYVTERPVCEPFCELFCDNGGKHLFCSHMRLPTCVEFVEFCATRLSGLSM